ncbi:MAG: sel1 repeat family protein [Methylococcaceae bacterium]|nr:sel1 repeat family protein [Methylococcaceae bacterium]
MTDKLPIISGNRAVIITATSSTTLIGRGLNAIQRKETGITKTDLDTRYRQARDIYNRITDYGREDGFKIEAMPETSCQSDMFEDFQLQQLQPLFNRIQQLAGIFAEFQQLADQGYGKAYFPLSFIYQGGQGTSKNSEKAGYYYRLAFDWCFANQALNDPELWNDLGRIYRNGRGVLTPDNEQYVFWCSKAAEHGNGDAQTTLGWFYDCGFNGESDKEKAAFWYLKAAEQGNMFGYTQLSDMNRGSARYGQFKDKEQTLNWLHIAAKQGYARAQCDLGEIYLLDLHEEQDYKKSMFWFKKAAEQGYESAQWRLGRMYANGLGVEQDYIQAVFLYRRVADYCAWAQFSLSEMYQGGWDIEQDYEQAVLWCRKSAGSGYAEAQNMLGWRYENGIGVEQDKDQAVFWYRKASQSLNKKPRRKAQKALENLGIKWKDA